MARWTAPDSFEDGWDLYEREMRNVGRKPKTLEMNRDGWERLVRYVTEQADAVVSDIEDMTKDHVNAWVAYMRIEAGTDPQSLCIYFRTARPMFTWWAEEENRVSPFHRATQPPEPERPVPVQTDDVVNQLLAVCQVTKTDTGWRRLIALRDDAMIRTFFDVGVRRGELHGMLAEDWRRAVDEVHVRESKTYTRDLAVSPKTAVSIVRYVRERERYMRNRVEHGKLWVNRHGKPLTPSGINQTIDARRRQADLPHRLKPQHFRHTHAHNFLLNGGEEGDLVKTMGWNSRQMVDRYGASAAAERARAAQRKLRLGDRLR